MNYDPTETPKIKHIVGRLAEAERMRFIWQEITNRCYGESVAGELRKIAPNDPYLLYDYCGTKLQEDGLEPDEITEHLDEYSKQQWQEELDDLRLLIAATESEVVARSV